MGKDYDTHKETSDYRRTLSWAVYNARVIKIIAHSLMIELTKLEERILSEFLVSKVNASLDMFSEFIVYLLTARFAPQL
jgi:hypothetical protein